MPRFIYNRLYSNFEYRYKFTLQEREERESSARCSTSKKKRTIVIYGDEEGDANALNSPLIPNDSKEVSQVLTPKVSVDLTKEDNDTAASTDTIPQLSQLTQNLAFLEKILMNL